MSDYILIDGTLYHHGIKGQKWGQRNYQNPDGSYTAKGQAENNGHGRYSSINNIKQKVTNKWNGLTDKQKKALLIGASVTVAGLALGYLYKQGYISAGKEYVENAIGSFANKDFSKLSDEEKQKLINPKFGSSLEYVMNCGNCAIADDAQQRGIDVTARGNMTGMTLGDFISHYKDMPSKNVLVPDANDLDNIGSLEMDFNKHLKRGEKVYDLIKNKVLSEFSDNSRGAIFVPNINGSHWMTWKIENGEFQLRNTQDPSLVSTKKSIVSYLGGYKYHANYPDAQLAIIRTDNVEFDHLYDAVRKRGAGLNTKDYDTWKVMGENFIIKKYNR